MGRTLTESRLREREPSAEPPSSCIVSNASHRGVNPPARPQRHSEEPFASLGETLTGCLLPTGQPQVDEPPTLPNQGIYFSKPSVLLVPGFVVDTQFLRLRGLLCNGLSMPARVQGRNPALVHLLLHLIPQPGLFTSARAHRAPCEPYAEPGTEEAHA